MKSEIVKYETTLTLNSRKTPIGVFPEVKVGGKWFSSLGWKIGDIVNVMATKNKITIRRKENEF